MKIINPQNIQKAEIVVGVPSYNEADNIPFVVGQASRGLETYFPKKQSVIINVDNHSTDGTQEAFLESKGNIPKIYVSTEKSLKGKGYNFHNLFSIIKRMEGKVGLTFDADLKSIQPAWVKRMVEPILDGYDYLTPYYARYKHDATITNHLVCPLVYGLFGRGVRQPIGGDFAFSNKAVDLWLEKEWGEEAYRFGIDIFMTLNVYLAGLKTAQVNLDAKIHKLSDPSLSPMFLQVVKTLFEIILKEEKRIRNIKEIEKVEVLGGSEMFDLTSTQLNKQIFRKTFIDGLSFYWSSIKNIVSSEACKRLNRIRQGQESGIERDLWAVIVYDFLYAYKKESKPSLIEILRPCYFGRVASFFESIENLSSDETIEEINKEAEYFFEKRSYYLARE